MLESTICNIQMHKPICTLDLRRLALVCNSIEEEVEFSETASLDQS